MNISYNGLKEELTPKMQAKLDAKFAKLSKLLEQRGEKEAHVIVKQQRHFTKAEVTIQFYDHSLVGVGTDGDVFTALAAALANVETQALKTRDKWREKHRRDGMAKSPEPVAKKAIKAAATQPAATAPRIYKVTAHTRRKPITLEEAMLEMGTEKAYVVYRDADRDGLSVLVRRRDGHYDLIES